MDLVGDVAGREIPAQLLLDARPERIVEGHPAAEHDEEQQPALAIQLAGVHDQAIQHLRELLHGPVELAGAHPDAGPVEGRVRPSVDDATAPRRDLDPVAVAPHTGVGVEVTGLVALHLRIVPEPQGHRRQRLGEDQFADLADHRPALRVERFHLGAQPAALNLARAHRQERAREGERGADVGASADRAQQQVTLDMLVHPAEALGRQRRAGRAEPAQPVKLGLIRRIDPGPVTGRDVGRAGAEVRHAGLLGQPPQRPHIGITRAAVVQHDRRAEEQPADHDVPHHPAGGGEPEEPVVRPEVQMEREGLEALQQDPTVPLDDRLRQSGRAGGVDDPQRVIEGDGLEGARPGPRGGQPLGPHPSAPQAAHRGRLVQVGHQHRGLERRELALQFGHQVHAVVRGSIVPVPVDREEDPELDLPETVHDAADAELGRATRPDRPQAGRGEERDQGLGDVGHEGDDPVAATDPHPPERGGGGGRPAVELGVRQDRECASFGLGQDGGMRIPAPERRAGGPRQQLPIEIFAAYP